MKFRLDDFKNNEKMASSSIKKDVNYSEQIKESLTKIAGDDKRGIASLKLLY
jgi:hypothetical protein